MGRSISRGLVCLVICAATAGARASANEPAVAFKIIVNARVPGRTIGRDVVAQIYLGKVQHWGDGDPIAAVDHSSTSPLRQAFSHAVLAMSVDGVKQHWLRTVSVGRRPPITKSLDEDVIAFVAAQPGGIGYVSEATPVPSTVRAVPLR